MDLSHIFERDVEFASTHHLTSAEAVDVAIPPVLDEAAVALSAHEADLTQGEFASLVADHSEVGSGWNSPVTVPTLHASHHGTGHAGASRSPVRGGSGRSFSPDSIGSGRRATSPGSSTSFSIGTPPLGSVGGTSPPSLHPFTKHLQEALEKTEKKGLVKRDSVGASSIASAGGTLSASQGSLGLGGIPFPSAGGVDSLPNSPSLDQLNDVAAGHDVRRLSFISMADVINDERMAEITGSQFEQPIGLGGGGVPSRTVSGGSADLPDIFAGLNVAGPPLGGSLGTGTSTPTKHWRD
ncbi:hypothetical protein MNV49_007154 [Pseudohyphozyma bogoriensis]|nr:hypothetical protein MNV49_007154 [Pseudohyphozyma bogoriensis]